MRCEIVAVGTELLLGQIVDTNSSWLGEQLALVGIDSLRQTKVGDNLNRIVEVIAEAADRSDAVIVCGGLGPTHDDLTRQAIAEVMGVGLDLDDEIAIAIEAKFTSRERQMPSSNLVQAEVPLGALAIREPFPGTAPGLICPLGSERVIYALPGVPYELQEIFRGAVLPDLLKRAGLHATIVSRTLKTWGESESGLAERLAQRISDLDSPEGSGVTLAFLASGIEGLKIRLTAKSDSAETAESLLAGEEAAIRSILGEGLIFGIDDETMESVVLARLGELGETLGLAESLTGGLVSSRLVSVPGASQVFKGAIVSYASSVKSDLLGVAEGKVVSAKAAEAMAVGVRGALGASVGLSLTGVAGPDHQDGEAPGTVFVGVSVADSTVSHRLTLPGDRERIRQFAAISALALLRGHLHSAF